MRKLSVLFSVLFALFITAPAFAADVYLRGTLAGGWSDQSDWKFTDEGNSIYTLEKASVKAGQEFKIYDYNAGSSDYDRYINITTASGDLRGTVEPSGSNLKFKSEQTNVKFTYNANSKTLAIDSTTGGSETPDPVDFPISSVSEIPAGMEIPISKESQIAGKTFHLVGANNLDETLTYNADYGCYVIITTLAGANDWFKFNDGTWDTSDYNLGSGNVPVKYGSTILYASGDNCLAGTLANTKVLMMLFVNAKKLYIPTNVQIKEALEADPVIPTVYFRNAGTGWADSDDWQLTTADEGLTYTLTKPSIDANFEFLVWADDKAVPYSELHINGNVAGIGNTGSNVKFPDANYTDVTFTYTRATKSLEINGTKEVVTTVPWGGDALYLHFQTSDDVWADSPNFTNQGEGKWTTTFTVGSKNPFNFCLMDGNGKGYNCNQGLEMAAGNAYDGAFTKNTGNNGWIKLESGQKYTVTIQLNDKGTDGSIRFDKVTDPSVGDYGFGSRLFITFRNDADTTHPWETHEIVFEAYGEDTPNALNQFVYRFRANAMNIPFYLHNTENPEEGTIYASTGNFEVGHLDKYLFKTETLEGKWNLFKDLTLGEDYRIIVKAPKGDKKNETYLGIFPVLADMPWGVDPEGLILHSNFTGKWPYTDKTGVNISQGPALQYNEATGIWYVDFILGNPDDFSTNLVNGNFVSSTDQGYEFTFTDKNGINWYKSPIELPLNQWTDGAMNLLTDYNDLNFFVKKTDALKVGASYRMQLRKEFTGDYDANKKPIYSWQMRLTETPDVNEDPTLYIRSTDNKVETTVMPKALDVNGVDIPGYYIYTMPYNGGSFEVSTSKDNFDDNRLCGASNQAPIELRTPYDFYEHVGGNPEWTASDSNLGMISVVVNYNTKTLRIYSPSVNMALTSRHVERIPGKFDGEKFGVPASDLYNNVKGATDEHPVTFDRVNSINIQLDLTNLFFDRDCEFVIDGLTVNGSDVDNIAGRKINWADEVTTAIKNHIYHLPYSGHLTVDGQFATTQPDYTFVLTYTISKGELSKKGTTELKYTPNFQPYFVRPRPVADSDNAYEGSLRVQNAWLGNGNWAAVATRKVQFAGNTGEIDEDTGKPVLYCYNGADYDENGELVDPDLSKARIGVYPGFKVTVEGVTPEMQKHHVPACSTHYGKFGEGFFLANYTGHNGESTIDWSSAALLEGNLPVVVSLDHTAGTSGWLQGINGGPTGSDSRLTYEIYAHYPLYVYKGGVCADSFEEAEKVIVENLATSTPAVKAPVKRVFHNSTDDENSVCTERNHIGVHSIVATRKYNGMTELVQSTTGIEGVEIETEVEANQAAPEYYNLQGIRVANPTPGNVYILRQGNTTTKVRL